MRLNELDTQGARNAHQVSPISKERQQVCFLYSFPIKSPWPQIILGPDIRYGTVPDGRTTPEKGSQQEDCKR